MARLNQNMQHCAEHLQQGNLVAFPTETVYGLGANALDAEAVLKIFRAKGRPLTDPVIVHVQNKIQALQLIQVEDQEILNIFHILADSYWPGPLTMALQAGQNIPNVVTADTGFVGIRCPNHVLAQQLIEASGLPLAAPSANRFAHVSPTTSQHVLCDFVHSDYEIFILDGGQCSFGIESTVVKIYRDNKPIVKILRQGGISKQMIEQALVDLNVEVQLIVMHLKEEEQAEGPGMLLKHYSPDKDTFIVTTQGELGEKLAECSEAAVIDFQNVLQNIETTYRRNLSEQGNIEEAIRNLYDCLRWTEGTQCKIVLLPEIHNSSQFTAALCDRMIRSASNNRVRVNDGSIYRVNL